jgi:hypothetical protein
MTDFEELAGKLSENGPVRILDVHQAAKARGILSIFIHDGHYYMAPANGGTAAEIERILGEYRERGAIHFTFNAQSSIDTPHKPILPMDSFANRHFANPTHGVVKITAVSRSKLGELNALIEALKPEFDPNDFPFIDQLEKSDFKPQREGSTTRLTLRLKNPDWKHLRDIEEALRDYFAEAHYVRDILVGRHSVKGMDPDIMLSSTDETTAKGHAFLTALAAFLPGSESVPPFEQRGVEGLLHALSEAEMTKPETRQRLKLEPVVRAMSPLEQRRLALSTMGETLKTMAGFKGLDQTLTGSSLLIQFPKGILGGSHFDTECEGTLAFVHRTTRTNPQLENGWKGVYNYDRRTRLLTVRAVGESESAPAGWFTLF